MNDYIKQHNTWIQMMEESGTIDETVVNYHRIRIAYLQHERLAHLIVLCLVSVLLFGCFIGTFYLQDFIMVALFFTFLILDIFYILHYYKLENTVQRWYDIDARWTRNYNTFDF